MTNFCYYNDRIKEELDGACEYIQKAIFFKKDRPEFASMYIKMADAEIEHATNLVKMFEAELKDVGSADPIYSDIHEAVLKMFNESVAKLKIMESNYASK